MQRSGNLGATNYGQIDNLNYHYPSLSNQLTGITDAANDNIGYIEAPTGGLNTFTYYDDGSLKSDANKGITNIAYNYLGLIERVYFGTAKRIENIYTADGVKLATLYINGSDTLKREYIGDLIYVNDTLRSCWHDEGRIIFNNTPFGGLGAKYQYFINDHLENVRVVFQQLDGSVYLYQEVHYGVTGEILEGLGKTGDLAFLYQGKELIEGLGYDFQARMYDTWSMRFGGIDPVDNYMLSGYAGMMNNPVSYIDPDGRNPIIIGAFVAIFANTTLKIAQGKSIDTIWDFLKPGIVGAASAGIGSFVGGLTSSWGIIGSNIASGAASGFIGGGLNSSFNNQNFWKGGLFGAIYGSIGGGINGFLNLLNRSEIMYIKATDEFISEPSGVNPTDEDLTKYTMENFGTDFKKKFKIFTYSTEKIAPRTSGLTYDKVNGVYLDGTDPVYGLTIRKGISSGSDIYIAKAAFSSKTKLFSTTGHELIHAYQYSKGLIGDSFLEAGAYSWNLAFMKASGYSQSSIATFRNQIINSGIPVNNFPLKYSYANISNFPILPK